MTVGELIDKYCKEHEMSNQRFAELCGVSKGYISMLIKGINPKTGKPMKPAVETLDAIARAMGMTLDQLLNMVDDMDVTLSVPIRPDDDDEIMQMREDMRRNPELRTLYSLQRKATKQELRQMEAFIRAIRSGHEEDDPA